MAIVNAGALSSIAKSKLASLATGSAKTSAAQSIVTKTASQTVATKSAASLVGGGLASAIAIPVIKTAVSSLAGSSTYSKVDAALGGYLPGGITPSQDNVIDMHGGLAKNWNTGTTTMGIMKDGNWYAVKKDGRIKVFRPSKNIVFGKRIEPKKFIRVAMKYRGIHRDLNSVFKSIKIKRRK